MISAIYANKYFPFRTPWWEWKQCRSNVSYMVYPAPDNPWIRPSAIDVPSSYRFLPGGTGVGGCVNSSHVGTGIIKPNYFNEWYASESESGWNYDSEHALDKSAW